MKYNFILISSVLGICFGLVVGLIQTTSDKNKAIHSKQQTISILQKNYNNLKNLYQNLSSEYEKTKRFRQIKVLAKNRDSKNTVIGDIIYKYANNIQGGLSIYYKNLTTNESIVIDGDRPYYMASLYKVILTLYILDQIKAGNVNFDDNMGTGSATIEEGLNKIIAESNNEYAQMLAERFGWKNIEQAMKQKLGIDFSFDDDLNINVKNVGLLFEDISLSLKISDSDSNYLLKLMKEQKNISKLPKYLPQHIYSHNKTGEFDDYSHDAGIFYTPKANYILIFMSKTNDPAGTNEQMALMSKDVYEALNGSSQKSAQMPLNNLIPNN